MIGNSYGLLGLKFLVAVGSRTIIPCCPDRSIVILLPALAQHFSMMITITQTVFVKLLSSLLPSIHAHDVYSDLINSMQL